MTRLSLTAALALSGSASALQIPLQLPFNGVPSWTSPWSSAPKADHAPVHGDSSKLPLIDSETLQDRITAEALEQRAQVLYDIAKKGTEEYGHPTRVIGSEGKWRSAQLLYY